MYSEQYIGDNNALLPIISQYIRFEVFRLVSYCCVPSLLANNTVFSTVLFQRIDDAKEENISFCYQTQCFQSLRHVTARSILQSEFLCKRRKNI